MSPLKTLPEAAEVYWPKTRPRFGQSFVFRFTVPRVYESLQSPKQSVDCLTIRHRRINSGKLCGRIHLIFLASTCTMCLIICSYAY
jgi:hypothetical protein